MQDKKKKLSGLILTGSAIASMVGSAANTASADFDDFLENLKDGVSQGVDVVKTSVNMLGSNLKKIIIEHPKLSLAMLGVTALASVYQGVSYIRKINKKVEDLKKEMLNLNSDVKDKEIEIYKSNIERLFTKLSRYKVHKFDYFFTKMKESPDCKAQFIDLIKKGEEVVDRFVSLIECWKFSEKSAESLVLFLESDKEGIFTKVLKSHYFDKGTTSGLAVLLRHKGFGIYSLSKLFKLLENNNLGESIVDEFAILLGSWHFDESAANGFVLLLENCYSEQKIKGLKLLLRNCDKKSTNKLACMMGQSSREKFDEKAAKKLLLLLENFDGEAAENFRGLLKEVYIDGIRNYIGMIKSDKFSEKAAKGFAHLLKVSSAWELANRIIRCLSYGAKAVVGFFLILENCNETNANGVRRKLAYTDRDELEFFLEKCDSELAKKICMILKYANDNLDLFNRFFNHALYRTIDVFIDMVKSEDFGKSSAQNFSQLNGYYLSELFRQFDEKSSKRFLLLLNSEKLDANKLNKKIGKCEFDPEFFAKELCREDFNVDEFILKNELQK